MRDETLIPRAAKRLQEAGIENPRREAQILLQAAIGVAPGKIGFLPDMEASAENLGRFRELVERRIQREPMAYILEHREFWSCDFKVTKDTLCPRPDSETLVEAVLAQIPDKSAPLRLVDFGIGSGCLLLALLTELPAATGLGIDVSDGALIIARENAHSLGLRDRTEFLKSDWDEAVEPSFDLMISNPPYVRSGDIDGLQPEVARYEPRLALDGGEDGLACYRRLAPAAMRLLASDGLLALEIGFEQADSVVAIGQAVGLRHIATKPDLAGIERCVLFRK